MALFFYKFQFYFKLDNSIDCVYWIKIYTSKTTLETKTEWHISQYLKFIDKTIP